MDEATAGRARRHLFVNADVRWMRVCVSGWCLGVPAPRVVRASGRFVKGLADRGELLDERLGVFPAATATGADAEFVGKRLEACVAISDSVLEFGVVDGLA